LTDRFHNFSPILPNVNVHRRRAPQVVLRADWLSLCISCRGEKGDVEGLPPARRLVPRLRVEA
jgi:hypothetical protein